MWQAYLAGHVDDCWVGGCCGNSLGLRLGEESRVKSVGRARRGIVTRECGARCWWWRTAEFDGSVEKTEDDIEEIQRFYEEADRPLDI